MMTTSEMQLTTEQWFAMRATYGRNLVAQKALEEKGIETFVPMRKARLRVRGAAGRRAGSGSRSARERGKVQWEPAVRDLIFVRTERRIIQEAKQEIPFLHYIMRGAKDEERSPLTVPERQMRPFIENNTAGDSIIEWLEPADLRPGERFHILDGPFRGMEATLQRLPGRRSRSVIVSIEGLIAAAISVPIDSIERKE